MRIQLFIGSLFSLFALFSCSKSTEHDQTNESIFTYNQPNPITSLDPAFARSQTNIWATSHLYDGLVRLDDNLEVQAALAQSWYISEDGLQYRFLLRDDVLFQKNEVFKNDEERRLKAQDVVASWNRIIDQDIDSPGSWIFNNRVADENPFVAEGDSVLVLNLKQAFPPMLQILTMPYCFVISEKAFQTYGKELMTKPVGTGAFALQTWKEGQVLSLKKNPDYWRTENGQQLPFLDRARVEFIADRKMAYLDLIKGNVDFINGIDGSFVNEVLTKDGNLKETLSSELIFSKSPYLNTEYLGFNLEKNSKALLDKRVRQALNYGFDRAKMLRTLRNNVGRPAQSGFIPYGLPGYDESQIGYSYNPDKAAELLKQSGFPNGQGLEPITIETNKDYLDLVTYIARQWEILGVQTKIEVFDSAELRERMAGGKAKVFRASWLADYPDAENYLTVFWGGNPAPPNYTRFQNQDFDDLYTQALRTTDEKLRIKLYKEMNQILIDEAPVIFLFYDETARFYRKRVSGLTPNAANLLNLETVRLNTPY